MVNRYSERIGVVGGGIQGVGLAIELAQRGRKVDLFERDAVCLTRASAQNEGKIHLGFVYANDPSLATAQLCARAALRFSPILNRWLEGRFRPQISQPFHYLVHRDSLLSPDALESFYGEVSALLAAERSAGDYFGIDVSRKPVPLVGSAFDEIASRQTVEAAFLTAEIAVDPEQIAAALRHRLAADPRITVRTNNTVTSIVPGDDRVQIGSTGPDGPELERYDHVVNASWDSLVTLDNTAGIAPAQAYTYRYKYFLRIAKGPILPSVTIVLGGFGDVVTYGDNSLFLTWYPIGRRGMSVNSAPMSWPDPLQDGEAYEVSAGIVAGLRGVVPRVGGLSEHALSQAELRGGVIYAIGSTDVDDPDSYLHQRHAVGPRSFGRYHSLDPGKYSFAPLFAEMLAERIAGRG
jgi:glycine/D-amino acid oxidase-like deaminating enzyme